jgi:hypothetical protein
MTNKNPKVFKYLNYKNSLIHTNAPTILKSISNLKILSFELYLFPYASVPKLLISHYICQITLKMKY